MKKQYIKEIIRIIQHILPTRNERSKMKKKEKR